MNPLVSAAPSLAGATASAPAGPDPTAAKAGVTLDLALAGRPPPGVHRGTVTREAATGRVVFTATQLKLVVPPDAAGHLPLPVSAVVRITPQRGDGAATARLTTVRAPADPPPGPSAARSSEDGASVRAPSHGPPRGSRTPRPGPGSATTGPPATASASAGGTSPASPVLPPAIAPSSAGPEGADGRSAAPRPPPGESVGSPPPAEGRVPRPPGADNAARGARAEAGAPSAPAHAEPTSPAPLAGGGMPRPTAPAAAPTGDAATRLARWIVGAPFARREAERAPSGPPGRRGDDGKRAEAEPSGAGPPPASSSASLRPRRAPGARFDPPPLARTPPPPLAAHVADRLVELAGLDGDGAPPPCGAKLQTLADGLPVALPAARLPGRGDAPLVVAVGAGDGDDPVRPPRRLVLEVELPHLGRVRLDGLAEGERFDVLVAPVPAAARPGLRALWAVLRARTGLTGELDFPEAAENRS